MKNKNIDFYINSQEDEREKGGYSQTKIDFIIQAVGSKKIILDVGCNDGFIGKILIEKNNQVYGCDIVDENLKIAKKAGLKIKRIDIENEELSYPSNFFDFVILGDVIEHVFDTDRLLRICNKVLKNNGKIIITTPNIASLGRRIMLLLGISPYIEYSIVQTTNGLPSVGHIRYFTVKTLNDLLGKNGYKEIFVTSDYLVLPFMQLPMFGKIFPSIGRNLFAIAKKTKKK